MLLTGITTLGKTVTIVVAVTFIAWAIVTAIFIPGRRPTFPKRLDAFILVSAILFVAQMSAVVWVSETQEIEEAEAAEVIGEGEETTGEGTTGGETTGGETTGGETGESTGPGAAAGDAAAGEQVWADAGCGACHALADAGSNGAVGPNLDEAKPSAELVVERVTNGMGAMPAFDAELDEKQIADVAAYVVGATR